MSGTSDIEGKSVELFMALDLACISVLILSVCLQQTLPAVVEQDQSEEEEEIGACGPVPSMCQPRISLLWENSQMTTRSRSRLND